MRTAKKLTTTLVYAIVSFYTLPAAADDSPVVIGAIADFTGASAPNGEQCRRGFAIAWKQFQSRAPERASHVRVVYGDSRGEAKQGLSEFKRLVEVENAAAIVSTRSQITMPMNPLSAQIHIPLLSTIGLAGFTIANPYAFRFWPNAAVMGRFMADKVLAKGFHRAVVISLEDEYPLALDRAFQSAFKEKGEIAYAELVSETEPDFASIASRIKQAKPDIVFVNLGVGSIGLAMRRLREQGVSAQFLSNNWVVYPAVITGAGPAAVEGTLFADFDFLKPTFAKLYAAENNGEAPLALSYSCYASLGAVLDTLERHPEIRSRTELSDALRAATSFNLDDGPLPMKAREAQLDLIFMAIKSGKAVTAEGSGS